MKSGLEPSLFALSTILPNDKYKVAADELVQSYVDEMGALGGQLIWVDFKEGKFVRGGSTSMDATATRLFNMGSDNVVVEALIHHYPQDLVAVGHTQLSAGGDWLYWYTSRANPELGHQPSLNLRGFGIDLQLFGEILDIFDRDSGLTKAERRAIFDLVGGLSLAQSADRDEVSVETKRTQIKQSCTKLNCHGQTQLVKLVMGQLAYLVSVSSAETSSVSVAEEFVKKFLPEDARLTAVRLPNGRFVRYLDSGSASGKPVVFNYAIPYPNSLVNAGPFLREHNLRIITPLRFGYLEPDIFSETSAELLEFRHGDDDVLNLVEYLFDEPVPIVGSSTSTVNTIRLIDQRPELFSHLICLSPIFGTLGGEVSRDLGGFFKALLDAAKTEGSIAKLSWVMRQFNTDANLLKDVMLNIYGEIDSDVTALHQEINGHTVFDALADAYKYSFIGTTVDFARAVEPWEAPFGNLSVPISIIRGEGDAAVSPKTLATLLQLNSRVSSTQVGGAGHFITSAPEVATQTWSFIAQALDRHF